MPTSDRGRRSLLKRLLGLGATTAAVRLPGVAAEPVRGYTPLLPGGLSQIFWARPGRRKRSSSWDRTGKNEDFTRVESGHSLDLAAISGAGCIRHLWVTIGTNEPDCLRKVVLRAFWDGEEQPSVECPIGDFFGVGHAQVSNFWSLPLNMVTGGAAAKGMHAGMNCFFPMPYSHGARLAIENQGAEQIRIYYYVDFEEYQSLPADAPRLHAQWRRENPTPSTDHGGDRSKSRQISRETVNLDGEDNYVLLDAKGRGHYVGCVLSIDNLNPLPDFSRFGEGDDMIFIDGEQSPSLRGTGTEDYFCAAWGFPGGHNSMPYHGISLAGAVDGPAPYSGKWSMYRFHIENPVQFSSSIRVTIEHDGGNVEASDYSSVAYWSQAEPHGRFPALLPVARRLPIPERQSLREFWRTF